MTAISSSTRRPGPVAGTARYLLRTYLRVVGWTLAVVVVAITVAVVVVDRFGEVEVSLLQFGRQGLIWFPFSLMVIVASTYVGPHVAMGLTRRSLGRASLVVAAVMAVVLGGAVALLIALEGRLYALAGLDHAVDQGLAGLTGSASLGTLLVDHVLVVLAGEVAGLLVGTAYKRWHWLVATVTLPLTVAPAVVTSILLESEVHEVLDPTTGIGLALRLAAVVVVLALGAGAYLVLQRRTTIGAPPA